MWYLQFNTMIIVNGKIGQKNTKIDGFLDKKKAHRNSKYNKNNQIYWNQDIPGNPDIFPGKWELEFCLDSREFPFPGIPGANPTTDSQMDMTAVIVRLYHQVKIQNIAGKRVEWLSMASLTLHLKESLLPRAYINEMRRDGNGSSKQCEHLKVFLGGKKEHWKE